MNVTNQVHPSPEQAKAFFSGDEDGPMCMVNLLKFKDKASYTDSKTDEHDATTMKYLSLALIPCVGGYSLYTLKYQTHRSWYSWVLSSLVGAVYAFGFAPIRALLLMIGVRSDLSEASALKLVPAAEAMRARHTNME